jgi:hypothetical protein
VVWRALHQLQVTPGHKGTAARHRSPVLGPYTGGDSTDVRWGFMPLAGHDNAPARDHARRPFPQSGGRLQVPGCCDWRPTGWNSAKRPAGRGRPRSASHSGPERMAEMGVERGCFPCSHCGNLNGAVHYCLLWPSLASRCHTCAAAREPSPDRRRAICAGTPGASRGLCAALDIGPGPKPLGPGPFSISGMEGVQRLLGAFCGSRFFSATLKVNCRSR